jgi:hypothetical protein
VVAIVRELRESPQKVKEEPERAELRPAGGSSQEGSERIPWWRQLYRGGAEHRMNVTAGRAVYRSAERPEASGWGVATLAP